jgi:hypothetical protein
VGASPGGQSARAAETRQRYFYSPLPQKGRPDSRPSPGCDCALERVFFRTIGRRKTHCSTLLATNRRQHGCDSMRSRSIAAPVNLSTIERSPPPRDRTLRSPRLSRRTEDGMGATGPFDPTATPRNGHRVARRSLLAGRRLRTGSEAQS